MEPRSREETTDFGRIVRATPSVVMRATSEEDLQRALALSREKGLPLSLRGAGHSCNGQTLVDGGLLVLNESAAPEPLRLLEGDRVEVSGRVRWRHVEAALNREGRTLPVLPDYLDLSVGGTLSVGGYGVDSIHQGLQADMVERLRLVLPDGEALWCSDEFESERLRFALCGLGQAGLIERAVLRTLPYRPVQALFRCTHASLCEQVDSLAWMAGRGEGWPDTFKANASRGRFVTTYGLHAASLREAFSVPAPAALSELTLKRRWVCPRYRFVRSRVVQLWVASFRRCRRAWSDFALPLAAMPEFAAFLDELIRRDAFSGCLGSLYLLGLRRPEGARSLPFEAFGPPSGGVGLLVGLYNMVPHGDERALAAVQRAADACLRRCLDLGGRPYLYGWHRPPEGTWRQVHGAAWDRLAALQAERDPAGLVQRDKLLSGGPSAGSEPPAVA